MKTGKVIYDVEMARQGRLFAATGRAARRERQGDRRRRRAVSMRFADSSTPTTRQPASGRGASTRFRRRASRAARRGQGDAIWARGGGTDVADRHVRSAAQPALLGTGNPSPDWDGNAPPGRQPLHAIARGARPRHRRTAQVALPVHAARHARLGFDAGAGARRLDDQRPARARSSCMANRNGFFYVHRSRSPAK